MKYIIGSLVSLKNDNKSYLVLSTKDQILNVDFLKNNTSLNILNIDKIAQNILSTANGFDYTICEVESINNGIYKVKGEYINIFEEDLNN